MDTARPVGLAAVFPPPTLADAAFETRLAALAPADFTVLGVVFVEHPSTTAAVARRLGWSPMIVAARLAALEAAGLVTRDASDWPEAGI